MLHPWGCLIGILWYISYLKFLFLNQYDVCIIFNKIRQGIIPSTNVSYLNPKTENSKTVAFAKETLLELKININI